MKSIDHENFVGIYDDFFSVDFCNNLIAHYEWCNKNNKTYNRAEPESMKADSSTNLHPGSIEEINFGFPHLSSYLAEFNDVFWNECYKDYVSQYSTLGGYDQHTIFSYKLQKTLPAQGYHIWHCEDGSLNFSRRTGVYILYLNDVEDGGETEFLYFSKRIKPKQGRLLIFPPNYPWTHRGNPPLTGVKYIMTGWLEFQ